MNKCPRPINMATRMKNKLIDYPAYLDRRPQEIKQLLLDVASDESPSANRELLGVIGMNLYRVTNGNSEVAVLVIAETEAAAIEQARSVFQNADYCPEYSQSLEVETVFFDTSKPQCTAVIECSEVHWMENEG